MWLLLVILLAAIELFKTDLLNISQRVSCLKQISPFIGSTINGTLDWRKISPLIRSSINGTLNASDVYNNIHLHSQEQQNLSINNSTKNEDSVTDNQSSSDDEDNNCEVKINGCNCCTKISSCVSSLFPPRPATSSPQCISLLFNEDFKGFSNKVSSNGTTSWQILSLTDPINPINQILINDGKLLQECDGIVIDSSIFTTALPHPITGYHYALTRNIPFNKNAKGICIEFTLSEISKYTWKVFPNTSNTSGTPFSVFYECNNVNPKTDYRLAYSGVGFRTSVGDSPFIQIAVAKKEVYLLYGIAANTTGIRDKFTAAIPLFHRDGDFDEKYTFAICLNYDGSAQVFGKDFGTCEYTCLTYVPNIGVPPNEKKYIGALYSRNARSFISEPIGVDTMDIILINGNAMYLMDVLGIQIPKTALYGITADTDPVYRYLCECDQNIVLADTIINLPDATIASTGVLNFGQGTVMKLYNLTACYT
jgi:hypothetical protein